MRGLASVILLGSVLALCACTSSPPTTGETTPPITASTTPSPIASASATPGAPTSETVLAYQPTNETVLGFLDSQEGSNTIGPLSTEAPAIAVYVSCRGTGSLDVELPGLGSFTTLCQSTPTVEGVRNVLDVRFVEEGFRIKVEGTSGQTWAMTIAETTQETPS